MKEKKRGWLRILISGFVIGLGVIIGVGVGLQPGYIAGFNVGTDPYGAFGDRQLQWWSYNETQNPRVAKFQYLKQHHEQFDSYILGGSETSGYSVESLNKCFDAKFYNLGVYGNDMLVNEQYCRYLIEHYDVKNIVLNVHLADGRRYDTEDRTLTQTMPYQLSGGSALAYYKQYLFADLRYGQEKMKHLSEDTYLRNGFDVFDASTGCYDRRLQDAERISNLPAYLQAHPQLKDDAVTHYELPETERCMKSVAAIREMCEAHHVNLTVIAAPLYQGYLNDYASEDVARFYLKLAEATPYWDFSRSALSQDPRYFYDATHFRNSVGDMVLARIVKATPAYTPDGFGTYVTKDTVKAHMAQYWRLISARPERYTKKVPILMYHHLTDGQHVANWDVMTVNRFREQLKALRQAGYTAVTFEDLRRYVNDGVELPQKPVVITFDDGYDSNYKLALPVLQECHMKATVFVIGVFMGKDTYKDTGVRMPLHFDWEAAKKMEESGVIDIESHGYNIHEIAGCDVPPIREGCLQKEGETEEAYVKFLSGDCEKMQQLFTDHLGQASSVLAYPYGKHSLLSEVIVAEEGFDITLTTETGNNLLIKGVPQSLKAMNRYFIKEETTPQALLQMIG